MKFKIQTDEAYPIYSVYDLDEEDDNGIEFTKEEIDTINKAEESYFLAQEIFKKKIK